MEKLCLQLLCLICLNTVVSAQSIRVQPLLINTEKGLPSNTVFEVLEGNDGLLWVSTEQGVSIYDGYTIAAINKFLSDSLLLNMPASFYKEQDGTIWIHQIGQLVSYDKEKRLFHQFPYAVKPGTIKESFRLILANNEGLILQYLSDSCLIFNKQTTAFYWQKLSSLSIKDSLQLLSPPIYANGYYFSVNDKNELLLIDEKGNAQRKIYNLKPSNDILRATKIISLDKQHVLIGSGVDLLVVNTNTWLTKPVHDIDGGNLINTGKIMGLYKDRLGHIYVATNSSGVFSLSLQFNQFNLYRSNNPQNNFIRSVFYDRVTKKIYAGLYFNSVAVFNENKLPDEATTYQWQKLLLFKKINVVNRIYKIGDGEWILFANGKNFFYINDQQGIVKAIPLLAPPGMDTLTFTGNNFSSFANIERTIDGDYIVVYLQHILQIRYQNGVFNTIKLLRNSQSNEGVFIDRNKRIYIGNNGYIEMYSNKWELLSTIRLPLKTQVKSIIRDKNGLLWIGTRNGVFIYNNHTLVKTINQQTGLLNEFIYTLYADNIGFVWCSTNKGLAQINCNNFSIYTFTKFDGLQDDEFNSGAFSADELGNLYFGGINGITAFNPKDIQKETLPNQVKVVEVRGNGTSLYTYLLNGSNNLVTTDNINNFVFYFSDFGFNSSAGIYEYRVNNGIHWVPIRGQNFFNIYLTSGQHKIFIRKLNEPATETTFLVRVKFPFYKHWWFLISLICLMVVLIGFFVNRRQKFVLQEKEELLRREKELQVERARISRELHDNLGAHANVISYHTQQLSQLNQADTPIHDANNVFQIIKSSADEILLSLRETVWALQQSKITSIETWIRFQNFIFRMQDSFQHIHFVVSDSTLVPVYELEYQQAVHLIRILQEATNNAIKHSSASEIKFELIKTTLGFTIHIIDDGIGFKEDELRPHGNGLENMRARAKSAGFSYTLSSFVNGGTQIFIEYKST